MVQVCKKKVVSLSELRSVSRRSALFEIRTPLVGKVVEDLDAGETEVARQVVVATSIVS